MSSHLDKQLGQETGRGRADRVEGLSAQGAAGGGLARSQVLTPPSSDKAGGLSCKRSGSVAASAATSRPVDDAA